MVKASSVNKLLVALLCVISISFANAATHGVQAGSKQFNSRYNAKLGFELPLAPVGAFRDRLF